MALGLRSCTRMSRPLLLVDDDDLIRETMRAFFEREGFAVETASALSEATDRLAVKSYAAVIVDVCLTEGGTEGLALAAHVREVFKDLPVLIVTAYGSPQNGKAAADLGADAFLHKPVSLMWLKDLMREWIASRAGGPHEEGESNNTLASGPTCG
jgi:DNA-binding NtrC family response regulator